MYINRKVKQGPLYDINVLFNRSSENSYTQKYLGNKNSYTQKYLGNKPT